jgi:hypothetical protein
MLVAIKDQMRIRFIFSMPLMKRRDKEILKVAVLALVFLGGCAFQGNESGVGDGAPSDLPPGLTVDFARDIAPELEIKCLECHNSRSKKQYSSFDMETRASMLTTGLHAPVIVPGEGESSYFVKVLRLGHAENQSMPPSPDKILDDGIARIVTWIDEGAHWPAGFKLRRPDEW